MYSKGEFQVSCKMMDFLLLLSIIGIITSTMYALLVATGAVRLAQRRRALLPGAFAPPVSLLKPLHGLEPDLESHLQSFFEQDYPEFEIIFCARTDQDAGLADCPARCGALSENPVPVLVQRECTVCERQSLVAGAYAECRIPPVFRGQRQ